MCGLPKAGRASQVRSETRRSNATARPPRADRPSRRLGILSADVGKLVCCTSQYASVHLLITGINTRKSSGW
jgi:hypothetical protein